MTSPYKPLDFGEFQNVADLYVSADHDRNYPIVESSIPADTDEVLVACGMLDLVAIFDAERELVCLAPREKADLLTRLINTYQCMSPI